jgi:DNA-binding NarL/FixJ family response regulator
MDGVDPQKLAKVLALADSSHEGEVATALHVAGRILRSAGRGWGDLARLVEAGGAPPPRAHTALQRELDALRRALAGERARHAQELRRLREEGAAAQAAAERTIARLRTELARAQGLRTPQERRAEVVRLLRAGGLADREIARQVGVSPQTVGNVRRGLHAPRAERPALPHRFHASPLGD